MTLSLTARPTIVAREAKPGVWAWEIEPDDVATLRLMQADGRAGTAQRRVDGGAFVLVAWHVGQQREAAKPLAAAREEKRLRQLQLAPEGYSKRVYKPPGRPVGMRTHAPYAHEPTRW